MKIRSAIAILAAALGAITLTALPAAALDASCGMVITDRGTTVTLTSDLDCGPAPGITIAADDVTIDLGGHFFKGTTDSPYGIRVTGPLKRPAVTNGTIIGFQTAITVQSGFEVSLTNLRIKNTGQDGIDILTSGGVTMNTIQLDGTGFTDVFDEHLAIDVEHSYGLDVSNITERNWSGSGFTSSWSHDFTLSNSSFVGNGANNVSIGYDTTNAHLTGLTLEKAPLDLVVSVVPDTGTSATNVTVDHVTMHGLDPTDPTTCLSVSWSHNIVVDAVTATQCSVGGEITEGNTNVSVSNSTFSRNDYNGLQVDATGGFAPVGLTLTNNVADGNGSIGFWFRDAAPDLAGNTASRNGSDGFQWTGAAGGNSTGDTASNNGGNGFNVVTTGLIPVTVTNGTARNNAANGLVVGTGRAVVSGGAFDKNGRQGIYATSGRTDVTGAGLYKNQHSGLYFATAAIGSAAGISAVKNGLYGLAVVTAAAVTDGGGNTFYRNGAGDRCARRCTL